MKNTNKQRGITLVALVITIIILLILAGVGIMQLTQTGIFNKAKMASEKYNKQTAIETMNLKITNVEIFMYAEEQRMPTLKELADTFCKDDDFQYVQETSKIASLTKIISENPTSIYTKLKAYPYEFEINSSLQLASIDGIKVADTTIDDNIYYDKNIFDKWDTWLYIAGVENIKQYNGTNIIENDALMNKVLNNSNAMKYLYKSNYFLLPSLLKSSHSIDLIEKYGGTNPIPTSIDDNRIIYSSNDANSPGNQYSAFDKNDSTFWTSDTNMSLPQYIGWDFEENVVVYKFSIKNRVDMIDKNVLNFVLQGQSSNEQWEDIQSYTNTNIQVSGISTYNVDYPKEYSKYRIKILDTSPTGTYVQVNQLDFYYLK